LDQWEVLAQALLEHGQKHDVINVTETGFGPRYLIDGELLSQDAGLRACGRFGNWIGDSLRPGASPLTLLSHDQGTRLRGAHPRPDRGKLEGW
jgi:hypothetical protein